MTMPYLKEKLENTKFMNKAFHKIIIAPRPAFKTSHDLPPDIFSPLFDWLFRSVTFAQWVNYECSWQLNCTGPPGSGKTTFLTLAAQQIRRALSQSLDVEIHIASLYLTEDRSEDDNAFLRQCLNSISQQLACTVMVPTKTSSNGPNNNTLLSLDDITQALSVKISQDAGAHRYFLLIDSIDHCGSSRRLRLDNELCILQKAGLNVLVSSRLTVYTSNTFCDFHTRGSEENPLLFHWRCVDCSEVSICRPCMDKGYRCTKCSTVTTWKEPKFLNLYLDYIPEDYMLRFIAWDLEREHGDLGLNSGIQLKPPLSSLGISFSEDQSGAASSKLMHSISGQSHGNISLAKLSLDFVHNSLSVNSLEGSKDRLPKNMQAHFRRGIEHILHQPAGRRDLALKAIAAVSMAVPSYSKPKDPGLTISQLAAILRERGSAYSREHGEPPSPEQILQATNGYLVFCPPWNDGDEYYFDTYIPEFGTYAGQAYDDDLEWAKAQLHASSLPRSFTHDLTREERGLKTAEAKTNWILGELKMVQVNSPPMYSPSPPLSSSGGSKLEMTMEDELEDLKSFSSSSSPLVYSPRATPPISRRSTDYFRAKAKTSKSVGLGLD